jgi:hypothetical protein
MRWRLLSVIVVFSLATVGCASDPPGQHDRPTTTTSATGDPSASIEGVTVVEYRGADHVRFPQRVAYDRFPPFGGPHDEVWAACDGVVYDKPVRNENMVHSLEHGAVWIAYDPDRIGGDALAGLRATVAGQPYLMLSPYPGLDRPISLQSWGHQLKLDAADDPRVPAFIRALRANPETSPEPGASCAAIAGVFDVADPPPFDPSPPGPDAVPVG